MRFAAARNPLDRLPGRPYTPAPIQFQLSISTADSLRHRLRFRGCRPAVCVVLLWGACLASLSTANAAGDWVDRASIGPFNCRSEFRLGRRQQLMDELAQLGADIESTLEIKSGNQPIQLNIFRNRRRYAAYLSARVPEGIGRQALYVQGPDMGRVYVYKHWSYPTDIRHECTHALLHSSLPYVPLWLDEGLAEYFEATPSQRVYDHPHLGSLRTRLWFGWKPNLGSLESKRSFSELTEHDYRESWAWVHFLLHRSSGTREVLLTYLRDIGSGSPPGRLSKRIAQNIPNAEAQLIEHLKTWGKSSFSETLSSSR